MEPTVIDPAATTRAQAFALWMDAPNPMVTVSFQFHHTQMDGAHAGRFLQRLQERIYDLKGTI